MVNAMVTFVTNVSFAFVNFVMRLIVINHPPNIKKVLSQVVHSACLLFTRRGISSGREKPAQYSRCLYRDFYNLKLNWRLKLTNS